MTKTTKRIIIKSFLLIFGLIIVIKTGGCLFDYLNLRQKNQVPETEIDSEFYEKRKNEVEADPEFQKQIETNQKLDDALSVLHEADQVLSSQNGSSDFLSESQSQTESNRSIKSENSNQIK